MLSEWDWRGRHWSLSAVARQVAFGVSLDGSTVVVYFGPLCLIVDPLEGSDLELLVRSSLTTCPLCGGLMYK